MPRRKPIPVARRQFSQRPGMPIQARMQRSPGQTAGQARTQARNPMAGHAEMKPRARNTRRQMLFSGEMRKRASTRPAGLKAEWRQSVWFIIPGLGEFVTALRRIFYPQEHLRVMKRGRVGTGLGPIAKNRLVAGLELQRRERLMPRQEAKVLRKRTPGLVGTIASQHARGRIKGVPKYPQRKAA